MNRRQRLQQELEELQKKLLAHTSRPAAPVFDRVWTVEHGVRVVHQVATRATDDLVTMRCGLVGQIPGPHTRRQVYHFVTRTEAPLTCFMCVGLGDGNDTSAPR